MKINVVLQRSCVCLLKMYALSESINPNFVHLKLSEIGPSTVNGNRKKTTVLFVCKSVIDLCHKHNNNNEIVIARAHTVINIYIAAVKRWHQACIDY
jgi:hypothetical protein